MDDERIAGDPAEIQRLLERVDAAVQGLTPLELGAAKAGMEVDTYRDYLRGEVARRRNGGASTARPGSAWRPDAPAGT